MGVVGKVVRVGLFPAGVALSVSGARIENWRREKEMLLFFCAQLAGIKVGWAGAGHSGIVGRCEAIDHWKVSTVRIMFVRFYGTSFSYGVGYTSCLCLR